MAPTPARIHDTLAYFRSGLADPAMAHLSARGSPSAAPPGVAPPPIQVAPLRRRRPLPLDPPALGDPAIPSVGSIVAHPSAAARRQPIPLLSPPGAGCHRPVRPAGGKICRSFSRSLYPPIERAATKCLRNSFRAWDCVNSGPLPGNKKGRPVGRPFRHIPAANHGREPSPSVRRGSPLKRGSWSRQRTTAVQG
jgi:hypothetical protein